MAFKGTRFSAAAFLIFLCSFLRAEVENDVITCLQSIKDSLEDPHDSLHTWDFKNKSKDYICNNFHGVFCDDHRQVFSIELGSMGLKGQFPWGIVDCSSLQLLDLSHNELSGNISSRISSMLHFLFKLDLSYNKFSGEIPASIGNLDQLNILRLNNNEFFGEIPRQLGNLPLLAEFSVANNLLWGPVPVFSSNVNVVKKESYLNNKGLCGAPLEPCDHDQLQQSFREGLIVGYVFSATFFVVVNVLYLVRGSQLKKVRRKKLRRVSPYYAYLRRKWKEEERKNKIQKMHLDLPEKRCIQKLRLDLPEKRYQSLLHLNLQEKVCQEITEAERLTRKMSFVELCDATDFFSVESAIGVGSIGVMYKARIPNGWFLAVKRLYDSQLFRRQFHLEIMILGRYRHRNIVPLLGFCDERVESVERKERIIVYKYMPNGRLSDWLSEGNGDVTLNWAVRIRIALGIARGLCWLHHNLHVVHFSICSECILLDQNFEPKISNFGEARFMHQNIGDDLDMSFHMENWFNYEKMDVYNFGTLLLELVEGKEINPMTDSFINNDDFVITCTASLSESPSSFREAIDKSLIGEGFDDEIFTLLKIACCCIQPFLDQRPTMLEVYTKMSNIWEGNEIGEDLEMSKKSEVASAATCRDEIVEIESI